MLSNVKLRERRKQLGLSMKEVANIVGVTEATISRWETGDISNMKRDKIALYAKALEVSPSEIMGLNVELEKLSSNLLRYSDEQIPEELVILNRKAKNWSPEKRKQLLDMARVMFKEDFDD